MNSLHVQIRTHIRVHCDNSTTVHCINRGGSAPPVLLPHPGPSGSGDGCIPDRLVQMELPVPFSPESNDFEGFEEARGLPRRCLLRSSILAKSTLVSSTEIQSPGIDHDPPAPPPSVCRKRTFLLQLVDPSPPCRVDFLRSTYASKLSWASVNGLIQAIRKSSRRQFESSWKAFTSFVQETRPEEINNEVFFSFMKSIFDRRASPQPR